VPLKPLKNSGTILAALCLSCAAQDSGTLVAGAIFWVVPLKPLKNSGTIFELCRSRWRHNSCGTILWVVPLKPLKNSGTSLWVVPLKTRHYSWVVPLKMGALLLRHYFLSCAAQEECAPLCPQCALFCAHSCALKKSAHWVRTAEDSLFYRALLQKRPIIVSILLTEATPYKNEVQECALFFPAPHSYMGWLRLVESIQL